MLRHQSSSAGATNDIPKLVDENGKVSELVETNIGYITCYTEKPLSNGDKLDLKCELWTKGVSEIFLAYKEPTSTPKLGAETQKITLTGKSAYFILEIKDGKLRMIDRRSRKEETLNVEQEPCWVCFRLKRSRIKMLSPALRDGTALLEKSESFDQTDETDLVVTSTTSGPPESSIGPLLRTSLPVHQFAEVRIKLVDKELEELMKHQDAVDAALRDLGIQQEILTNRLKRNQVEVNTHLALKHSIQEQISKLKQENTETRRVLQN